MAEVHEADSVAGLVDCEGRSVMSSGPRVRLVKV
jgi:hypothetical protein